MESDYIRLSREFLRIAVPIRPLPLVGTPRSAAMLLLHSHGVRMLHVSMNGDSQVLYRASWDVLGLAPSPDGRFLAYGAVNSNSNVWTIPNLPEP